MCEECVNRAVKIEMAKLEIDISDYLKKFPAEQKPLKVEGNSIIETPPIRYRPQSARIDPGWTRKCPRCISVQYPTDGTFLTFYHECPNEGLIEWPHSIGRNYA